MDVKHKLSYKVYNNKVLYIYDLWVLGFSNHFLWKCPTRHLRTMFQTYVSTNHLDIGVGTGYYLEKCLDNIPRRLALLDLNINTLIKASSRIAPLKCEIYKVNILKQINLDCEGFDSISLNYVLHCLPGKLHEKTIVFQNIYSYLNKGGILFGSTILGEGVPQNYFAKKLMALYNKKGIFSNYNDSIDELESLLQMYFSKVKVTVIGNVACFYAQKL